MSTIEPTTDNLIVQRGSDLYTTTIEDMSTIQDDDLVMIGRGSESYKINGKEFKEQAGGGGGTSAPEIFSVELTGSGPGFDNETYTTTVNYNPGEPLSTLGLKGKVSGTLSIAGDTSNIVGIDNQLPWSTGVVTSTDSNPNPANLFNPDSTTGYQMGKTNNNVNGKEYFVVYGEGLPANSWPAGVYTFDWNTAGEQGSKMNNFYVQLNAGGAQQQVFATGSTDYIDGTFEFTAATPFSTIKFACTASNGSYPNAGVTVHTFALDGVRLIDGPIQTIFTLASDANLDNGAFVAGDTVKQDNSPIVPTSSTITNVNTFNQSYITSDPTANLYNGSWDYVFNGRTDSSNTSTQSAYYYESAGSVTTTPLPSGTLEIYAQRPSANIGSGAMSITVGSKTINLTDVNTPTWYNFGVQSNITEISVIGTDPGVAVYAVRVDGVVLDQASATALTLTNSDGLDEFQVGDVVQGPTNANTSRIWSSNASQVNNPEYAFDGDLNTMATGNAGSNASYTFTPPFTVTTGFVLTQSCQGTWSVTNTSGVEVVSVAAYNDFNTPLSLPCSGEIDYIYFSQANGSRMELKQVFADGKELIDSDLADEVSITDIDPSAPSITTDGGSWVGTDGTGDATLSGDWSSTSDMVNAANAFDGNDTSTVAGCKGGSFYNTITTTPFTASEIEIKCNATAGVTDIKVNDGNGYTPVKDGDDPGWFKVTLPEETVVNSLTMAWNQGSSDGVAFNVYGVKADGVLLTDTGISDAETFVTGPATNITATFVSADPLVPSMTVSDVVGPWNVGNYVVNTVVNPITIKPETSAITAVTESGTPAVADYAFFDPSYTVQGTVADREVVLIPGEYPSVNTANKINYNNSGNVTDPGAATINVFDFTALGLINDNSGLTVAFDCVYQGGNDWSITPTTIKFSDGSTVTGTLTQGGAVGSDSQYLARMTFTLPNDVTTFAFGTSWSQASSGGTGGLGSYIGNLKFGLQEIDFEESTLQTILSLTDDTDLNQFATGDNVYAAGDAPASFAPVIYTGNAGTQDITTGIAPDLVWIKSRTDTTDHNLFDTVRGAEKRLFSNTNAQESASNITLTSFNPDGFSLSSANDVNKSGGDFVAWCWDAGDTTVTNNEGTIESQVRSNGNFSIIKYTGSAVNGSYGHGLSSAPSFVITKNLTSAEDWVVYHTETGTQYLSLNSSIAASTANNIWREAPTSSVINVGTSVNVNTTVNSAQYVSYCWAESPTQSFGSYIGNGTTSGPTIDCGFEPAFVMFKGATLPTNWTIVDNARNPGNPRNLYLSAQLNAAEDNLGNPSIEFTSTGFKVLTTNDNVNNTGDTFIYAAFSSAGGPSGVVGDITGLDMTLSESTGTWEVGQKVTMDAKPAQVTTAYLEFDSGTGVVETLSTVDPGFKPAPPGNILRFTTPNTGQTWDEELPVGTVIQTKVKATNELGSSTSEWTAPVVPRALTLDMTEAETTLAYTEAALSLATFNNRHMVYCGQQAEAERDNLIANLAAQGYDLTKILTYL